MCRSKNRLSMKTFVLLILLYMPFLQLSAQEVIYGGRESDPYHLDLLKLALSYSPNTSYEVKRHEFMLPKQRAFMFLAENQAVDVLSGPSTKYNHEKFRPIPVPLFKGLKGWRLALISKNTPNIFENIRTKAQFTKLTPVQFHTWNSIKVLEFNNINVITGSQFRGLFKLIHKQRADYFPRSLLEVDQDLLRYPEFDVMLDSNILIKYPGATYFFVNKNNVVLAEKIEKGLKLAIQDGSFDRLFEQTFGDIIKRYNLENRQVIELENPFYYEVN